MNMVFLVGRLTADPALRYTQSGQAVCRFTVAVDRSYKRGDEKETDYIDVVVWRKLAELCANHLFRGRTVALHGSLRVSSYEKDGQKRKHYEVEADEVQFLDAPKSEEPPVVIEDDLAGLEI